MATVYDTVCAAIKTALDAVYAPISHSHTKSDVTDLGTIPSASTSTPSADTSSGSYGSGTSYARSNHTHPKSSLYAESSHTHNYSNINNVTVVDVTITYTDSTTATYKLMRYTGS